MGIRDILTLMVKSFFIIVTATVACLWAACALFFPTMHFTVPFLGQILVLGFVSASLFLVFYSKKDIKQNQMRVRVAIHLVLLLGSMLLLALYWRWVSFSSPPGILLFIGGILFIYAVVCFWVFRRDQHTAQVFNQVLLRGNTFNRDEDKNA